MQEVGHASAENGDRVSQEPVGERPVSPGSELQDEPNCKEADFNSATADISESLQIRGDLATGRGENFDYPEQDDDLWDLCGYGFSKEAKDRWMTTVIARANLW
jgi:hypothetical protein